MSVFTEKCTLVSFLAKWMKIELPEEWCCEEHDVAYEQGGSIWFKFFMDWKLIKCVRDTNPGTIGLTKAALGLVAITLNPYSYLVWITHRDI